MGGVTVRKMGEVVMREVGLFFNNIRSYHNHRLGRQQDVSRTTSPLNNSTDSSAQSS